MTIDIEEGVFGPGFLHGYASAAYQVEGGYNKGGRGPSVWDIALKDRDNGEVGCDSYNRWTEDIELLKLYGANSYRFSISWSRVIPLGGRDDPVNEEGILYYSRLIDGLLAAGIVPVVTLFHWDVPEGIDKRYGGFLPGDREEELYLDFERYARLCFARFGDRPQVVSMFMAGELRKGSFDMQTDRWKLARTLLLSHARAVDVYRREFQTAQQGQIGITLNIEWVEPFDASPEASDAAQRSLDVMVGLFAGPIYHDHWNSRVQQLARDALPPFSPHEQALLAGSSDFFGLNHYSTRWATGKVLDSDVPHIACFGNVEHVTERDGVPIGCRGHNGYPYNVPWGFYRLLHYVNRTWAKPEANVTGKQLPIFITENGYAGQDEANRTLAEVVEDVERIDYYSGYLSSLVKAKQDGVPIMGYMAWSLMDNLEWSAGYAPCFGVTHVDRKNGLKRTPKGSAFYLRDFFARTVSKKAC